MPFDTSNNYLNQAADFASENLGIDIPGFGTSPDSDSGTAPNAASGLYKDKVTKKNIGPKMWSTNGDRWHQTYGYRFSIGYQDVNKKGGVDQALSSTSGSQNSNPGLGGGSSGELKFFDFTLPVPPQQVVVKPIYPSQATATLGGVVEETSQVKFWVISLSGTTGTSISRLEEDLTKRKNMASKYREAIETTGLLTGATAAANQIASQLGGLADARLDLQNVTSAAGGIGTVTGAISNALTPQLPYNKSSVDNKTNGFVEAQELQKFFFMYNALKSRYPKHFALMFSNFKTDQSWRCIVKDFQLQQASDNPYLFRYSIQLQCWDVRPSADLFKDSSKQSFDRFGQGGDLQPVNTLTANQFLGGASALNPFSLADNALF